MHQTLKKLSLVACTLFAMGTAHAESCGDTSWSSLAASGCSGSFVGNLNGSTTETDFLASLLGGAWTFAGSTSDAGDGPFASDPGSVTGGTLTFDSPLSGRFVIGLKAAHNYSYFYFDALTPVSSLSFDTTAGIATNAKGMAQELSHATLYTAAVPEPETWALMALGLGVVFAGARRRG